MSRLVRFLRSPAGVLVFLVAAMVAQTPHAAEVFARLEHGYNGTTPWTAWVYAIGLEGLILLFVINGKTWQAWLFFVVSVAVNACYYYAAALEPFAASLISFALPLAIALNSHLIAELSALAAPEAPAEPAARVPPWQRPDLITLDDLDDPEVLARMRAQAQPKDDKPFACRYCGKGHKTQNGCNAHEGRCAVRKAQEAEAAAEAEAEKPPD